MARGSDDEPAAPVDPATPDDVARRAFHRLAGSSLAGSYRLAVHLVGDRSDAEDVVQEALTLAWRGWPSLRDHDRFEAWFERIVVNTAYERLRKRRRKPTAHLPDEVVDRGADRLAAAIDRDAIGRALDGLSPDHRVVVILRYWRDLPIEAIAERLGVPSGTVRSRLHYALLELRRAIDPPLLRPEEARP
ncbi:MAG TPA: RNA polymerase sigma factor [Candidatus Limnocylindrales bacterium]|nr:RNA polymerase sigma factor [Candidatus Limnocylindrales bacterium]